jgi:hypothetical protein
MLRLKCYSAKVATQHEGGPAAETKPQNSPETGSVSAQDALKGLPAGQQAAVRKHLAEVPRIHRETYLRAATKRSRVAAVKAFCLECMGWQKGEVRKCTALTCPLWSYRPYR